MARSSRKSLPDLTIMTGVERWHRKTLVVASVVSRFLLLTNPAQDHKTRFQILSQLSHELLSPVKGQAPTKSKVGKQRLHLNHI